MEFDQFSSDNVNESENFKRVLEKYLNYYKWFFLSVLLLGIAAFLYLRRVAPEYNVSASLLIKEKEEGSSFADLSSFESLGLFGNGDNSLENEIQILKSRGLMNKVVDELKLNIQYFLEDSPYDKELFPNFPIVVNLDSKSTNIDKISTNFKIVLKSKKTFEFIGFDETSIGVKSFGKAFQANLGNEYSSNKIELIINLSNNFNNKFIGKTIIIKVHPINKVTDYYLNNVVIEPINEKNSKVLYLSLNTPVAEKGVTIINNLIAQYNADGINDKNLISQTTTDFLDQRIGLISAELITIESTAEQFKSKNRMVDAAQGSNYFLESSSLNERELVVANTQLQLVSYMLDELNKKSNSELLPGNIGLSDQGIINLIGEYNDLVLQRNRILKSSSIKNPIIVGIDSQLSVLKNNLKSSLNSLKSSSQIQINALSTQSGKISSRIASVPKNEREYKDIVRQQETKNALYLFLLQKREESILSNAVNIDKAKTIDSAYSNGLPISPKKKTVYFASVLLGLLIPFIIIYLKDILDNKVHDEKDIQRLKTPYLGDIPLSVSKKNLFIKDGDNSNIAEAFRYVRTNINFMLDSKDTCKTVFITSTQSHEGKTFTAINLASSLAISGKKTLLLGLDLRAPKISKYLELEDILGATNYIKNKSLTLNEITDKYTKIDNLHLINSGDIPPNPVELLMSKRVNELFDKAKQEYEYIIVDTAPVGMVTDTIQISKYADLTIYVIKANYLDKRMLQIPQKLKAEDKLPNMAILINGSDHSKGAYGYGYGYGNIKKSPWYTKLFSF